MVSAWMYGLKERLESKVIPRHRTCGTGESVKSLMVIDRSGKGGEREGEKMMSSVLSMLSFKKREEKKEEMADRHSGILESREWTSGPER